MYARMIVSYSLISVLVYVVTCMLGTAMIHECTVQPDILTLKFRVTSTLNSQGWYNFLKATQRSRIKF